MSRADGSVIIDVTVDPKRAINGLGQVQNKVNSLASAAKKLTTLFVSVFAVHKIVQFGKEAVELGSNVAEVQNVVDVAFGEMAYKVEAFADTAIESFGMSQLAAKKTASTYMSMAKNMGLSMDTASDMAITLAGLTGDVASFYNISQDLADIKLKSVFTGETETLKDLGIVMTQANLEAYALERGIRKNISAMSQAELVTLRYNFVVDQLAMASGDFVRTQDSWANQTRILSMQWQEFMSIIGQALIQVLLPVVRVLNQIVSELINVANSFNAAITAIFGGANTQVQQTQADVSGVSAGISEAVDNQNALTDATKETNKEQKKSVASFDEIRKLSSGMDSGSAGRGGATVGGLAQFQPVTSGEIVESGAENKLLSLIEKLKNAFEPFKESFDQAFADISSGVETLMDVFRDVWRDIQSLGSPLKSWFDNEFTEYLNQFIYTFGNTLGGLFDSVGMVFSDLWNIAIFPRVKKWSEDILPALTEFSTKFLETFDVLFDEVKDIFDKIWREGVAPALDLLTKIWNDTWDGVLDAWEKWGEPIFEKVKEAIQKTGDTLKNVWDTILKPVWDTFITTVDELWTNHLKPLWDNFTDFVGGLIAGALDIYNKFILPIVNWFVDLFGPAISDGIGKGISKVGELIGVIADSANKIIDNLRKISDFVTNIFTKDWEQAWEGIKSIFTGIWNGIVSALESAVNFIVRGVNHVIGMINDLLSSSIVSAGLDFFGIGDVHITPIQEVTLPRLAQGAVIPPNREFLAVLGDQKQGTNIEAPLNTIVQAVMMALSQSGIGGDGQVIENVLTLDGEVIYRNQKKVSRRHGMSLTNR